MSFTEFSEIMNLKLFSTRIVLCKMINIACPETIDERVINKGSKLSIFKVLCVFDNLR